MNCRGAAHAFSQIATLLELHDEDPEGARAMQAAARTLAAFGDAPLGETIGTHPLVASTFRELSETNGSLFLESLQERTPEGLLEMLRVPGLGPARIRALHDGLHVETLQELEAAARDGRVANLPKFGNRTAGRILKGIADLRSSGSYVLWQHAHAEAARICEVIGAQDGVLRTAIAGSIRRRNEVVGDIDIVAAVDGSPAMVAMALSQIRGVEAVLGGGGRSLRLRFTDGVIVDLSCVRPHQFALALWRATGSSEHVKAVTHVASELGFTLSGDELRNSGGELLPIADERDLYELCAMTFVEPERREGNGEIEAAQVGEIVPLLVEADLAGALHCHSQYSDGGSPISEMAAAALERGLGYLGVSDHSQSNTYAGGLSREAILRQHDEIDGLNNSYEAAGLAFRILKGIEADILPCGRVDYDASVLDRFDFVIGSIHTRYGMNERQMTDRVLKALDDPHITILGHPTGRLLLTREAYAIDLEAVIEKAGRVGVAVELNADPHRLDIDWRACRIARKHGTMVSIGPDAHSPQGFSHLELGVAIARKGWLSAENVLNTRSLEEVLAFARARKSSVSAAPQWTTHAGAVGSSHLSSSGSSQVAQRR